MTQKEIDKFLANTKVYVNGKSKEIQEKLFSLGYYWSSGKGKEVLYENTPFLYISKDYNITYGRDMCAFIQHEHREISAEEILSLELTEPSYRPFKNKEECWNEMLEHQPFGWVNYDDSICAIQSISPKGITITDWAETNSFYFEECLENLTFTNDTPFGIKEE